MLDLNGTASWHWPSSRLAWALLFVLGAAMPAPAAAAGPKIAVQPVITHGLAHPVYAAEPRDGSGRLFIVEQAGRIRLVKNGALVDRPFLDISRDVRSTGAEQGLLGLAFDPQFGTNGRFIVQYTRQPDGAIVVAEYHVGGDPNWSDPSGRMLLTVPHPYANHNAGMIEFGPDGYLYVGMGDGGSSGDPDNRGQNRNELLGKILRINVTSAGGYTIPTGNPFALRGGRPEIFAWGFRNPWRFSFDRDTGQLWVGDVGQNAWEEIDIVEGGRNYGWRVMEGRHCYAPKAGCPTDGLTPPVAEYRTQSPRCAITGGYVYRGRRIPALTGWYVFGDYCSGEIMALSPDDRATVTVLRATGMGLASFGEEADGELLVVDLRGGVYRIVRSE
jgi:glucose/arabinose dehydrogenase